MKKHHIEKATIKRHHIEKATMKKEKSTMKSYRKNVDECVVKLSLMFAKLDGPFFHLELHPLLGFLVIHFFPQIPQVANSILHPQQKYLSYFPRSNFLPQMPLFRVPLFYRGHKIKLPTRPEATLWSHVLIMKWWKQKGFVYSLHSTFGALPFNSTHPFLLPSFHCPHIYPLRLHKEIENHYSERHHIERHIERHHIMKRHNIEKASYRKGII